MSRRAKIWLAAAIVFILGNIAGGVYAAALGERMHAELHAALALAGFMAAWALSRGRARAAVFGATDAGTMESAAISDRLAHLENSMDAVAIEVERIGEGQRFMTRVLTQDKPPVNVNAGEAAPEPARKQAEGTQERSPA